MYLLLFEEEPCFCRAHLPKGIANLFIYEGLEANVSKETQMSCFIHEIRAWAIDP